MVMLVGIVSGVVVHRKIFADFFTFRPGKGQRSWLDAHNLLGVLTLPFQFMITYTGLIFFAVALMPVTISAHYDGPGGADRFVTELTDWQAPPARSGTAAPLAPMGPMLAQAEQRWGAGAVWTAEVWLPGDARASVRLAPTAQGPLRSAEVMVFDGVSGALRETRPAAPNASMALADGLLGLHEGLFAGPLLRALYLLSGLAGTAMVATGLVLWTVKRREKLERRAGRAHAGLRLMERVNVATVFGLPVAVAAHFWANRLLPAGLDGRAGWEAHVLFIAWGLTLLHAALRPPARAWFEQAVVAAIGFGALPLLNAVTTQRHLAASIAQGDAVMAGMDLGLLGLGLAFALTAVYLHRRAASARCEPAPALRQEARG